MTSVSKPEYALYKIEHGDYIWLDEAFMQQVSNKFSKVIGEMNATYELEWGTLDPDGLKDTISFKESLYLMYKFLTFDLWGTPNLEFITKEYLKTSSTIVVELCLRGIYPLFGCEPTHVIRSCFNFVVVIDDVVGDKFVVLLKTLFERGVNVSARQVKNFQVVRDMVFAYDVDKLVFTEDFSSCCKALNLPNGFHSLGKAENANYNFIDTHAIDHDFGMSGMFSSSCHCIKDSLDYQRVERLYSKSHSIYYVETWSQTFDGFRVEDVLLQLWLAFNSSHGMKNDVFGG